ncbi:hypothetical protein FCM35_KLT10343 [Carex littledalei]|uniref:Uncharacterized protein n=1 Tax=Carex littledalei TaxID=544730 RepID=A0A833V5P9_9POAL|nr:hypothetical protein FCM35_KLT10343 [Carex littledalei]
MLYIISLEVIIVIKHFLGVTNNGGKETNIFYLDFEAKPVIALYWKDELINCSMCEKKWWHRCEFNHKTKRSFCQESQMVLKAGISIGITFLLLLGCFAFFFVRRQSKKKKTFRQKIELFLTSYRVMNSIRKVLCPNCYFWPSISVFRKFGVEMFNSLNKII